MFSFPPSQKELRLQYGLNRWPAKRAQKVKGTHTVSLKREKSIFVSSALNAYQAIDILLLEVGKKQKAADKTDSSYGIYLAGGLSRMSGLTIRSGQSVGPGYGITKPVSSQPFRRLHYYSIVLLFTS